MRATEKLLKGIGFYTVVNEDSTWTTSSPSVFENGKTPAESLGRAIAEVIVRKRAELEKQSADLLAQLKELSTETP